MDSCSLLNLYTGWSGLNELSVMGMEWHVCEAVLRETEYTLEYAADGALVMKKLDLSAYIHHGKLLVERPISDAELDDYLEFACEVDDGEAQALAIAKHRGFILLTDDRKALRLARRPDVGVATISTAAVLQDWAGLRAEHAVRLPEVIARIEKLAKFRPRKDAPEYTWWITACGA